MLHRTTTILLIFGTACTAKLDTTRHPVDNDTFGHTVFTLACQRVAYTTDLADGDGVTDVSGSTYRDVCRNGAPTPAGAYGTVEALAAHRDALIGAVDGIFPDAYLADLQTYLTSNDFLTLYDDGTIGAAAERTEALFGIMRDDADFAPALAHLDGRFGYRPGSAALGALRAVTSWDKTDDLLQVFIDSITEGGAARGEWKNLQLALSKQFLDASAPSDRGAPDRTLSLAMDLLFTESPLLGTGQPHLLARRDDRGLVIVAADPATGQIPPPFTDADGDGRADADAQGRFILTTPDVLLAPPPFATPFENDTAPARDGSDGRALQFAAGPPLYDYVDLDKTVLAALARDAKKLFDPTKGTGLDMLRGASALLGPRVMDTHSYADGSSIQFRGYDATQAPLLDLVRAYTELLNDPNLPDTLSVSRQLIASHQPEAARLLEAILTVADLGKSHPEAQLVPGTPLYDDLVPIINQILATPGLSEDLLRALEDPATEQLAHRFSDFMKYKDQLDYDPSTQQIVGALGTAVDRAQPDSAWNRSLMERLLHLINDSSGVVLCSKAGAVIRDPIFGAVIKTYPNACDLLQINDLAVFFVQSIAYAKDASGNVIIDGNTGLPMPKALLPLNLGWLDPIVTDDMMESQSTITGFRRHPTPEALARVLLLDPAPQFISDVQDPALCKDGDRFIDAHSGTLPVWELNGFYDQIRPMVQAFADHDAEPLFVALLVALHKHYPSKASVTYQDANPSGAGYSMKSDLHSWEPFLIDIIDNRDLWPALTEGAATIDAIHSTATGRAAPEVLANTARYLFGFQAGLANRNGATATVTEDGRVVPEYSPYYLLADAYKAKRAAVLAAGPEGDAWERSTGALIDILTRGEDASPWRFKNPRFRGITAALVDFVGDRVDAHRAAGDLTTWTRSDLPDRAKAELTGPVFAGVADVILSLAAAPESRATFEGLQQYLFDEAGSEEVFVTALTAVADLSQLFLDDPDLVPIAHVVGKALDPDFGLVDAHLAFLRAARHAEGPDANQALAKLVKQLFSEYSLGQTSIAEVVNAIAEVNRVMPYLDLGKPMSAEDYRAVFDATQSFLHDEQRGLPKFIRIVQERHVR